MSRAKRVDVLTPEEAAARIGDGATVAVSGVVWSLVPEQILTALEKRFLETGAPRDLTEMHLHVYGMGPEVGLERFAHEGMTKRIVGGSFAPPYWFKGSRMNALVAEDKVEVFMLPAGVISAIWRAAGAGRPGILTDIGIGTFIDPRHGGGMLTESARESGRETVQMVELDDREWLYYRSVPVDVSLIRATTADEFGNLALDGEPIHQSVVDMAMAAKASGGIVLAQVKELVEGGSIDPRLVQIPDILVDGIVVCPDQAMFEYGVHEDSPAFTGEKRIYPVPPVDVIPPGAERFIAQRALAEVSEGDTINLGAGTPVNSISKVLRECGIEDKCTLSVEHGSLGGVNLGEFLCQTHWNPTSMISSTMTLDLYTGGVLDVAFLGMAQVDGAGNVNVAKVGDSLAGVGGFMDIAQSAATIAFCGTLTYGGLEVELDEEGKLGIVTEGRRAKFVTDVDLVSFSGSHALQRGQRVIYLTERCAFELRQEGLVLTDVAVGIDIERDVRSAVEAPFEVAEDLRTYDLAPGAVAQLTNGSEG